MNILLIGGTGAIGEPLAKFLQQQNHNVVVTSRRKRTDHNNLRYVVCNGHDPDAISRLIQSEKWDVVVDFLVYSSKEFPQHIAPVISNVRQYIFVSSARVFAESKSPITETSARLLDVCEDKEYLKTDEYALRKARCENMLQAYDNFTIVRPSITFNENRLQLGVYELSDWLSRILNDKPIVLSNDFLSKVTTMTYGADVAKAIAGLCGNPKALKQSFNITTSEYLTWKEVVDIYFETLEELGITPEFKVIEHTVNLRIPALKYQVLYARLFNRRFDNSKLLEVLPAFKFSDSRAELKKCLKSNVAHGKHDIVLNITNILQDRISGHILKKKDVGGIKRYAKYLMARFAPEKLVIKHLS